MEFGTRFAEIKWFFWEWLWFYTRPFVFDTPTKSRGWSHFGTTACLTLTSNETRLDIRQRMHLEDSFGIAGISSWPSAGYLSSVVEEIPPLKMPLWALSMTLSTNGCINTLVHIQRSLLIYFLLSSSIPGAASTSNLLWACLTDFGQVRSNSAMNQTCDMPCLNFDRLTSSHHMTRSNHIHGYFLFLMTG